MPNTSYFAGPPIPPNNDDGLTDPQVWDPVAQTWVSGSGTYAPRGTAATLALDRKLRAGTDGANVLIAGDSTGNEAVEFFQQSLANLGARFPGVRVTTRLWNDGTQAYGAATVLQAGAGVARGLYCTPSNGAWIQAADSAALSIVGDLDIHCKVAMDDWTPAAATELCSKTAASPQIGWFLRLNTDGTLTLFWSNNGTATLSVQSTVPVPFADGTPGWVRFTMDVDNGATGNDVKFYTGTDGVAWTQLGATKTTAGVTSMFDSTAVVQFPGRLLLAVGASTLAYQLRIFNGIAGTQVADLDVADMVNASTAWTGPLGVTYTPAGTGGVATGEIRGTPTLALYNASASGQALAYSNDGTRGPKQQFQQSMDLAFINYGHNEAGSIALFRTAYKALADAIVARWPDCGIVACAQNPETAPRSGLQISSHSARNAVVRSLAASQRYSLVDAYDAFTRSSLGLAGLVLVADGVHTTQAGSDLWAAEASALFNAS